MFDFFLTDSLEKVFADTRPRNLKERKLTTLRGAKVAFQLVYFLNMYADTDSHQAFEISVEGSPVDARFRNVCLVPSDYPASAQRDGGYLRTDPGLFPDLLTPSDCFIRPIAGQYRSVYIDLTIPQNAKGSYTLTIAAKPVEIAKLGNGQTLLKRNQIKPWHETIELTVLEASLPAQSLLVTQWFHTDCLANYYQCEVFSEKYWTIVENFIQFATKEAGINMLLTPIFTPPLDTEVGGERTTVQLVDITKTDDRYSFKWSKLRRWCSLCKNAGITHLEMAHLFTQWGALYTPKIMATVKGQEQQIFGWSISATDPAYRTFLSAFLPALLKVLEEEGYKKAQLRFHVSDEPSIDQLQDYLKAKEQVLDLLEGCTIMDALSNYEFYKEGVVEHPVPANNHIGAFIEHKVPNLWVYYCVAQSVAVPNRFFSMPSSRNRIMGILMYLYAIEGFLHWGYNFYNTQYSKKAIDPFRVTDCDLAFPSGDAFIVYPGEGGKVYSSLRNEVQVEGFEDMRCLTLLEQLTSREFVVSLLHEGISYPIMFNKFPLDPEYILQVRRRCLEEIGKRI